MLTESNPVRQSIPWPVVNEQNIGDSYAEGPRIKVRCTHPKGVYHNFIRRREGDVFTLIPQYVTVLDPKTEKPLTVKGEVQKKLVTAEEQFSSDTMERVEDDEPIRMTTAQQALNIQQDEINGSKIPMKKRG